MPLLINGKLVRVLQYSGIWHVAINTVIKQTVHCSGMQHVDIHDVGMSNMEEHSTSKHFPSVACHECT
jgi:hypothetical protein